MMHKVRYYHSIKLIQPRSSDNQIFAKCNPYVRKTWQDDYKSMQESMIYGEHIGFDDLLAKVQELQERFHSI